MLATYYLFVAAVWSASRVAALGLKTVDLDLARPSIPALHQDRLRPTNATAMTRSRLVEITRKREGVANATHDGRALMVHNRGAAHKAVAISLPLVIIFVGFACFFAACLRPYGPGMKKWRGNVPAGVPEFEDFAVAVTKEQPAKAQVKRSGSEKRVSFRDSALEENSIFILAAEGEASDGGSNRSNPFLSQGPSDRDCVFPPPHRMKKTRSLNLAFDGPANASEKRLQGNAILVAGPAI